MSTLLRLLLLVTIASATARASSSTDEDELGALVRRALARAGLDGATARGSPPRVPLPSVMVGGGASFAPTDPRAVAGWSVWARLGWPLGASPRIPVEIARDDVAIARARERIVKRVGELWQARRRLASRSPPGDTFAQALSRLADEELAAELAALVGPEAFP